MWVVENLQPSHFSATSREDPPFPGWNAAQGAPSRQGIGPGQATPTG
jgi:hypothetical protein